MPGLLLPFTGAAEPAEPGVPLSGLIEGDAAATLLAAVAASVTTTEQADAITQIDREGGIQWIES